MRLPCGPLVWGLFSGLILKEFVLSSFTYRAVLWSIWSLQWAFWLGSCWGWWGGECPGPGFLPCQCFWRNVSAFEVHCLFFRSYWFNFCHQVIKHFIGNSSLTLPCVALLSRNGRFLTSNPVLSCNLGIHSPPHPSSPGGSHHLGTVALSLPKLPHSTNMPAFQWEYLTTSIILNNSNIPTSWCGLFCH